MIPLQEVSRQTRFTCSNMSERNFFAELKRRNVYKVAIAYAVVAWLLIQIATQVFPFFEIPNWAVRLVVLVLIAGFPVALVFSWLSRSRRKESFAKLTPSLVNRSRIILEKKLSRSRLCWR